MLSYVLRWNVNYFYWSNLQVNSNQKNHAANVFNLVTEYEIRENNIPLKGNVNGGTVGLFPEAQHVMNRTLNKNNRQLIFSKQYTNCNKGKNNV